MTTTTTTSKLKKAKPSTPQFSWMDKPVPQAWIDKDPEYFARLDHQVRMIKDAAVKNDWDISGLTDREIHVLVWRTKSDAGAVKKVAQHLASMTAAKLAKTEAEDRTEATS
jgi:hypothetical protein